MIMKIYDKSEMETLTKMLGTRQMNYMSRHEGTSRANHEQLEHNVGIQRLSIYMVRSVYVGSCCTIYFDVYINFLYNKDKD